MRELTNSFDNGETLAINKGRNILSCQLGQHTPGSLTWFCH